MSNMFDLSDRVFLVTGASSGLGARFARTLAGHGAAVIAGARRLDKLDEQVSAITKAGGKALAAVLDVTRRETITAAFDLAEKEFGPVTGLVNNAGIVAEQWVLDVGDEDFQRVIATNLTGAWWCAQEAATRMTGHKIGGNIVNIASVLADRVSGTTAVYAISKAGLVQMTRAMALEFARHEIRVNAIAPGYILTDINSAFFNTEKGRQMIKRIPQNRIGEPKDLDAPLLLLASDACPYMTGAVITVDGGQSLTMA